MTFKWQFYDLDYTGSSVKAIDYIPNLRGYNFNNRISSCCVTSGVWILYSGQVNGLNFRLSKSSEQINVFGCRNF